MKLNIAQVAGRAKRRRAFNPLHSSVPAVLSTIPLGSPVPHDLQTECDHTPRRFQHSGEFRPNRTDVSGLDEAGREGSVELPDEAGRRIDRIITVARGGSVSKSLPSCRAWHMVLEWGPHALLALIVRLTVPSLPSPHHVGDPI